MVPNRYFDDQLHTLKEGGFRRGARRVFWNSLRHRSSETAAARPELVRELRVIRWVGLAGACAGSVPLFLEGVSPPTLLLLPAGWMLLCSWVKVELGLVRHPVTSVPAAAIGPANVMTMYRGWASIPVVVLGVGTAGPDLSWFALCMTAGLTDLVDGRVALRFGQESRLGRLLDPVMDAFFFSAAAVGLAHWGLMPWWVAVLIAVRYFLPVVTGLILMLAKGRTLPVRHTPWGQRSTAAIGLALTVGWVSSQVRLPSALPLSLDIAALFTMILALRAILRQARAGV